MPPTATQPVRFALFADLCHGVSTRHGGVSPAPFATLNMGLSTGDTEANVVTNRSRFLASVDVPEERVVIGRLSHGNHVSVFSNSRPEAHPWYQVPLHSESARSERIFRSDAAISDVPNLWVFMTFADCVPLLFRDTRRGVIGAAHAGWRGTALGVAPAVVRAMTAAFGSDPADIAVGIGPSIGPCCYTVGSDVTSTFRRNGLEPVVRADRQALYLDLWATNIQQLEEVGVHRRSIENLSLCTHCHVADFYSHRGERGKTGRFALTVGIR